MTLTEEKNEDAPPLAPLKAESKTRKRALVVADQAGTRHALTRLLQPAGFEVQSVRQGEEGLELAATVAFDVAVVDIALSGSAGLDLLRQLQQADAKLMVVLITEYGTADLAIRAMQMGAYDYVLKPFDVSRLKEIVIRAAEVGRWSRTPISFESPAAIDPSQDMMVGINPAMQDVYKRIGQVADTDAPILVRGETGTGKELVARAIYHNSRQAALPFIAVNCAAIPEGLLESELFGHERGAFTHAFTRRIGKFEQANKGTIFLDEIGDMAIATQGKILRVLQDGTFQRVGGDAEIEVEVRIIAATHRDLEADILKGTFREDLYYRINVVSVWLPPLRERKDDLPRLIDYFIGRYCAEEEIERVFLSSDALERLILHDWPGNIRELQNCLMNAMLTCRAGRITADDVLLDRRPGNSPRGDRGERSPAPQRSSEPTTFMQPVDDAWVDGLDENLHASVIRETERRLIAYALHRCKDNQVHAAQLLGISRSMLRDRLKRYKREEEEQQVGK